MTNAFASNVFTNLQKVGKALMLPVSVLPAAGLLVALGRLVQDSKIFQDPDFQLVWTALGKIMFSGGLAIFEQLPLVFAVGVAIGFTSGAGVAGLAAAVGYFTMTNVLKVISEVRGLELAINTGVFGGIIVGLVSAALYHRFFKTTLHPVLGFFSGKRLVPIVTAASAIGIGLVLGFIWPPIQDAINTFGTYAMNSQLGPAFYAAGKRLLIPVGLHHVYYPTFLFEFGEFVTESGKVLHGESARYFAGDPSAGRFMAAEFPIMLFGLPAAALAMYLRAPKIKRKAVGGIMLTAALTSIITGITEPIEFAFIFVAPLLYVFHVIAAFGSGLLTGFFDIHLGYTFSASMIDFVVGFFNQKNSLYLWLVVGPLIFSLYFSGFYWLIKLFDFKTPGRDVDSDAAEPEKIPPSELAVRVLAAIGDRANIDHLDACITRLRLTVVNPEKVDQAALKSLGAVGIMKSGKNFQIIFGVTSEKIKDEILSIVGAGGSTPSGLAPVAHSPMGGTATPTVTAPRPSVSVNFQSPLSGEMVAMEDVPDATFAQKILGEGFAIRPTEGVLYSPVDAEVVQVFRTGHAIGLRTSEGAEILIHIGLDTVKMNGEGFLPCVKQSDKVLKGDKLIEFDLDLVRQRATSDITPVVFTNMDKIKDLKILAKQTVQAKDDILSFSI